MRCRISAPLTSISGSSTMRSRSTTRRSKSIPANATVRLNLALAYYKSGRPNEAIEPPQGRRRLREPDAKNAYLILADCYLQTGQDQEAVALLKPREAMFRRRSRHSRTSSGWRCFAPATSDEGQQYIDRIFKAGESAEAHLLMGIAHLNRFDYPAAKTELERALSAQRRACRRRTRAYGAGAARARRPGRRPSARSARSSTVNINDFEANLMLGSMRKSAQRLRCRARLTSNRAIDDPADRT